MIQDVHISFLPDIDLVIIYNHNRCYIEYDYYPDVYRIIYCKYIIFM